MSYELISVFKELQNFMSLIKNRECFKVSSRKWNIIHLGDLVFIYTGKFVEQQGRKKGGNKSFFQNEM